MQCNFLITFVLSWLTVAISAAPAPTMETSKALHILDRIPELARSPEPEPGCKIYTCI
ncbi:hypothetical protein B0H17DRAFT_1206365 [Mycena rosella]|uniref:Uncharacterized protein n=1 Tax=Mycena rosella TaxID=1033263 RepID=A0AAD7D8W1_MYCRO|nr:hypothetical protein B0H17DRAFT_1206365 [Mycena rosella]